MPRGVYDRSKFKKKAGRPAKTEVKQKRKYTRRAEAAPAEAEVEQIAPAIDGGSMTAQAKGDLSNYELLNQLTGLGAIQTTNQVLRDRIDGLMLKFAERLSTSITFDAPKAEVKAAKAPKAKVEKTVEEKVETKDEVKAEASDTSEKNGKHTVLPAPVPFIAVPSSAS